MLSINPDAHSVPELDHMHWGVEMARKGGVPADRILNAMCPNHAQPAPEAALTRPRCLMLPARDLSLVR